MKSQSEPPERMTLSVTDTATVCGLSERTIRDLISRGDFPVLRVGRRVLVVKSQLEAWLARSADPAAGPGTRAR